MEPSQNYPSTSIEMMPKSSEEEAYSSSNETTSQNYIPQGYNNQQNYIPQNPNNPDFQPQNTPYNSNQPYPTNPAQPYPTNPAQPYPTNPAQPNITTPASPVCSKILLIVMSIIQFLFVIIEIIVLSSKGWMGIVCIHIDEVIVLGVSILFFLSYFEKFNINPVIRTIVVVIAWFIGTVLRSFSFSSERFGPLFALMGVRTFILFFSIPISFLTAPHDSNSSVQVTNVHGHHYHHGRRGRGRGR